MCPPSFFGSCFASKMDEFEEQLAETVKNYSHLYNCANKPYKDSEMAKNSWKEIAQLLCTDEIVCRKRWRSLRDKFAKAKRRVQSRKRSPGGKKIAIPALYTALQWLDVHVKNRQTTTSMMSVSHGEFAGGAHDLEKEQDRVKQEQLDFLPVISTVYSPADSSPSSHQIVETSFKPKRQSSSQTEKSSADARGSLRDEDELFLLSLLPSIKRLTNKKKMEVRMRFQQVLYAAEFDN